MGLTDDDWLTWLLGEQNGYGSWGETTEMRDTSEVVTTYRWLGLSNTSLQAGSNWAAQTSAGNLDYLARQTLTLVHAGEEAGDLDDPLIATQNDDGGWGYAADYGSDPLSTLLAVQALEAAGHEIGTPEGGPLFAGALYYLMASQAAEGGWGYTGQDESRVAMTALVLETLRPYRNYTITGAEVFVVQTEIDEGLTWLKGQQNPDGGWGEDGSVVYKTALASLAILHLGDAPTDLSGAQDYLLDAQQPDGSWEGDAFTTAVARRALSTFPWDVRNDNNVASTYFDGWQAGDIAASMFYPDSMDYPVQVERAIFWLDDFASTGSVTVRVRVYAVTPDLQMTLLELTNPFVVSGGNFFPNAVVVDLTGANVLIHSPDTFLIGVEYVDGVAGSTPSILTDSSTNIDAERNFYSLDSGSSWQEHYDFWPTVGVDPTLKGYNMIRASVRTNASIPQAVQGLSAQASGANDLVLSWPEMHMDNKDRYVQVWYYSIHRSTDPYFVPTPFNQYGATSGTNFTDPGVLGDLANNYYYVVTTVDTEERASAVSNRVGKFNITIAPGWNMVSLPLLPGVTALDDVIGDQLTGTCDSATADRLLSWNPETQEYEMAWYCDCDPWGEPWDNHWLTGFEQTSLTLEPDVGVWIQNRSGVTETIVLVGDISAADRTMYIEPGWQMAGSAYPVPVALDDAAIPATGTCDSATADRVLFWNTETQEYEMAWYCDCDAWGEPWDDHWLTGFEQTSIQLVPGKGAWYQNRHNPFTWVYPNPDPN